MLDDLASVLATCTCILATFALAGVAGYLLKLMYDAVHSDDWEV